MKRKLPALIVIAVLGCTAGVGQTINDPARIEIYVTPYYNSKGPVIDVGRFSNGLAAKSDSVLAA